MLALLATVMIRKTKHSTKYEMLLTQVSVVSSGGQLLREGGVVKALDNHFILPGHSGDVVHYMSGDFFGHHAKHTDLQH